MSAATEALCNHPVFRFFRVISDIPRPSKHEEQISQFLFRWARERGLEAEQDEKLNILIRKPATPGYEGAPGIMLQAHMDMVCEKAPEAEHDFMKDPIHWELDGDILSTGRRTTLGADDGIGVAMAMAVLDDDTLSHPALEVLFTTAEEDDFSGAEHFDVSKMTATRLINLDHANEKQILCGSCGGISAELTVPIASGPVPEGWSAFELAVDGLHGGHSGEDIHRITASQVFGVPQSEVTPQMRRSAKAVNFGIVYGISPFSLSQDIGVTVAQAKEYMEKYFQHYSGVRAYMDGVVARAKADGYVTTLFARRRWVPELKSSNFNTRSFGERVALNAPIQGTAADVIKAAMIRVRDRLLAQGLKGRLVLQVHDELIVECPQEEAEAVQRLVKEEMEAVVSLPVPLVADTAAGKSWADAH